MSGTNQKKSVINEKFEQNSENVIIFSSILKPKGDSMASLPPPFPFGDGPERTIWYENFSILHRQIDYVY